MRPSWDHFLNSFAMAAVFAVLCMAYSVAGQTVRPAEPRAMGDVKASAAFAEILLRRTELQAEVESLAGEYTDDHPKVAETRNALEIADKEKTRLLAVKPADVGRLTQALGKLILAKIDAEGVLWSLRRTLQDAHPDVKKAKRKVDIYEAAIREILG